MLDLSHVNASHIGCEPLANGSMVLPTSSMHCARVGQYLPARQLPFSPVQNYSQRPSLHERVCNLTYGACSPCMPRLVHQTAVIARALPFFGRQQPKEEEQAKGEGAKQKEQASGKAKEQGKEGDELQPGLFHPRFQLPLACALAGAAFESYLEPTGAEGFQERGLNGTDVTYTNSEFLSQVCQGILFIELREAEGLRVADVTGASDPYAIMTIGQGTARSKVIKATLDPVWNQCFFLYVKDMQQDILRIRLYDEDFIKSDDDLGVAQVALASLPAGEEKELTLPLAGPGGQGHVSVRLQLLPFSTNLLNALTSSGMTLPEQGGPAGEDVRNLLAAVAEARSAVPDTSKQEQKGFAIPNLSALMQNISMPNLAEQVNMPDLSEFADKLSAALDKLGLLDSKDGVSREEVQANPWKVLARVAGAEQAADWTPVAYIENLESETQVWLYRSVNHREAVISFRGTEQVKWKDLATDINLVPCSLNPERVDENAGVPLTVRLLRAATPTKQMMVHSGFLSAYDTVKPQVFRLLDAITAQQGPLDVLPWKVYITGHSLGGALATLCAYELAARKSPMRSRQQLTLYTYGAPRVGNKVFTESYDKLVPDSWRVTNSNDIIPSVPRLLGYAHVKHSVRLSEGGRLTIQADTGGYDVFGEGRGGLDVIQELVDQVQAQERTFEEVYEEIKQAELATLEMLVNGKALEEHMEDFYLSSLQQVVVATTGVALQEAASKQTK